MRTHWLTEPYPSAASKIWAAIRSRPLPSSSSSSLRRLLLLLPVEDVDDLLLLPLLVRTPEDGTSACTGGATAKTPPAPAPAPPPLPTGDGGSAPIEARF